MRKYTFGLSDFKAVRSATIVNEGITVIAGGNGCGKSTISRTLCNLVNIMSRFESFVVSEVQATLSESMYGYWRVIMQIGPKDIQAQRTARELYEVLREADGFADVITAYHNLRKNYDNLLRTGISLLTDAAKIERFFLSLHVPIQNSYVETVDYYLSRLDQEYEDLISNAEDTMDKRPKSKLMEYTKSMDPEVVSKLKFSLKENDVDLIMSNYFVKPLMLSRAIYVDTPMAVNENARYANRSWNSLAYMMTTDEKVTSNSVRKMEMRIRNIIKGEIKTEKDFSDEKELHYQRKDGLNILLSNAATGIKAFAYLEKLLVNGFLNNETLLIIDEPEAHLHPQWIVEFARILVLLNKEFGVHVMIASHNPDMVSAIRSITEREGLLNQTRFYLAKELEASDYKYEYVDLGHNISPIFESFNIALQRIEYYGTIEDR